MQPEYTQPDPKANLTTLFSPGQTIAIYTVMRILLLMKARLGLEAMLEYVSQYLKIIESYNPQIKNAVSQAVELISVEKVYKETVHGKET